MPPEAAYKANKLYCFFLTERGYNAPINGDLIEKNKRLEAHAGKIGSEEFFNWLMRHYGVEDPDPNCTVTEYE
jgi:hypothetical protein